MRRNSSSPVWYKAVKELIVVVYRLGGHKKKQYKAVVKGLSKRDLSTQGVVEYRSVTEE